MTDHRSILAIFVLVSAIGCAGSVARDPGLDGLAIREIAPATIVPGTKLMVSGASFVDEPWGRAMLRLQGSAGGRAVDVAWPATFVDFHTLTVAIDGDMVAELGDAGFRGTATVEVVATTDDETYASAPLAIELIFRSQLAPVPAAITGTGVLFVNDDIELEGDGFLLGGDEGVTVARLSGCFVPGPERPESTESSGECRAVPALELPVVPAAPRSRTRARFAFSPRIAGIRPGAFTGEVAIVNRQPGAAPIAAPPIAVRYDIVSAQVFSVDPAGEDPAPAAEQSGSPPPVTSLRSSGRRRRASASSCSCMAVGSSAASRGR